MRPVQDIGECADDAPRPARAVCQGGGASASGQPDLIGCWGPRGEQTRVPTPGRNVKRVVFGAVRCGYDRFIGLTCPRKNGASTRSWNDWTATPKPCSAPPPK